MGWATEHRRVSPAVTMALIIDEEISVKKKVYCLNYITSADAITSASN